MTVAFLHVPKAAGTSYLEALAAAIGGRQLVVRIPGEITSEAFQQTLVPESLRQYSFVAGHFDYDVCRRAPFLRPVTVLRDPVDRIVSWYHYTLRSVDEGLAPWRRFIEDRHLEVEDFLLHPKLRWLHGQAQTMQIAGYLWSGEPYPEVDRLVPEAEENLARFAHLGLYERLGDSLRLAQAELGLASVPTLPDSNVSPARGAELDPAVRAEVTEMLGMDSMFYPWAVGLFEQRLAAHGLNDESVNLASPERPPPLAVHRSPGRHPGPDPEGRPTGEERGRAGVGDLVELAWYPRPGEVLGGDLDAPLPVHAPEAAVEVLSGGVFTVDAHPALDLGANWLRVPAGVYQVQATVPCRRFGDIGPDDDWVLLFDFAWYGEPPIPYVPGLPGAADVELWQARTAHPGLPPAPLLGSPISAGGLLRVPDGGGHLCFLLGSTRPVVVSPGDQVRILYVKVG